MLPSFCNDTVVRIRPGTTTQRGSTIFDWNNATEKEITGCSMQPASTSLSEDGRVLGIRDEYSLFAPADADIKAGDRIRYGGNVYTIDGEPKKWVGAVNLSHIQLTLRRWSG